MPVKSNKKPFLSSRKLRQGSAATALTVVFVAAAVALNMLVGALSDRYHWKLDLSAEKAFVLSEESKRYLSELDKDINIYVLTSESNLTASGDYFIQANEVLGQYSRLSPRISVQYIDLTRRPDFASRYPQYQLNAQTILIECGDKVEPISVYDLYNIESDYYGEYIASSKAEQTLLGTLLYLTADRQVTAGVLTGFGEGETGGLVSLLEANRYRVLTRNLLTEELDPEISLLILCAPTRDYPEEALDKLERFLQGENDRALLYFAGLNQPDLPNLEAFLADWGIAVNDGAVYQTDLNMTWGSEFMSAVSYTEDVFAAKVLNFYSIMPNARPLDFLFYEKGSKTVSAPLIFGETACIQPLGAQEGWQPQDSPAFGPFAALAMSQDTLTLDDGAQRVSTLAVFSSQYFIDANMLQSPYIANAQYMLGMVEALTGSAAGISIAPKAIGVSQLPVNDFQIILLGLVFVVFLPLAAVFAGGVVFMRRRHL